MELRGYDDYEVTLGDQIRGERASLGKSIEDVERELHIKASLILGIENADLAAFPNPSVVSGYVRSYARYLRVDPEEFYLRFCEESGFVPPSAAFGGVTGAPPGARIGQRLEGSPFDQSRFANVPSQSRFAARVSLGWLASALALVALVGGIGYGGFALLQNVQRVGFAPLPEAPEVAAEPPRVLAAEALGEALSRPDAGVYGADGVLAAVFAPDDEPPIQRRDGPISAIDPNQAGVFARAPARSVDPRSPGPLPEGTITAAEVDSADDAIALAAAHDEAVRRLALAVRSGAAGERIGAGSARVQLAAAGPEPRGARRGVAVHAIERTWIRVRDENRAVIFEGILEAGRNFELPPRIEGPELRTGNAGGLFLVVDGAPHGPVGKRGAVLGGISLAAAAIRERFPAAEGALEGIARPAGGVEQRAASLDTD